MEAMDELPTLAQGDPPVFGRYRLGARLGSGGFGTVYAARDLRLLIAMDLVQRYPERVIATPDAFAFSRERQPREVAEAMRAAAAEYLGNHSVTYRRSNNVEQRLTLAAVLERQQAERSALQRTPLAQDGEIRMPELTEGGDRLERERSLADAAAGVPSLHTHEVDYLAVQQVRGFALQQLPERRPRDILDDSPAGVVEKLPLAHLFASCFCGRPCRLPAMD